MQNAHLHGDFERIVQARHHDPFAVLGRHPEDDKDLIRAYLPGADEVVIAEGNLRLERIGDSDLFEWVGSRGTVPDRYRLIWRDDGHREHIAHDPYSFPPQLQDFDLHLFGEGRHRHAYRFLGAHPHEIEGIAGVLFAVWAPNAERVSVVGDFNQWDGRRHPMRVRGGSGVWELFIPGLHAHDSATLHLGRLGHLHTGRHGTCTKHDRNQNDPCFPQALHCFSLFLKPFHPARDARFDDGRAGRQRYEEMVKEGLQEQFAVQAADVVK